MDIYSQASRPKIERLTADVNLGCAPTGDEKKPRRFSMLAYTGAAVERMFGKAVFDLSGIEMPPSGRVPILLNHDENKIVGFADTLEMDAERGLVLSGVISEHTEEGRKVAALSDEGFAWQASVGLQVTEWAEHKDGELKLNGQSFDGPIHVGKRTRLLESSFVCAGADKNTQAVALTAATTEEVALTTETPTTEETSVEPEASLAAKLLEKIEALEAKISTMTLAEEARHPGVGFTSPADTPAPARPQTLKDLWETDANLRAEFLGNVDAFASYCERHPDEAQSLLETE